MAIRGEGYPSLTARKHWGRYAMGIAAESVFILGLTLLALLFAVIAKAIW